MALKVHMKIHEREEERKAEELKVKVEELNSKATPIPRTGQKNKTPRRAAAMKWVTLTPIAFLIQILIFFFQLLRATSLFKEIEECTGADNTSSKIVSSRAVIIYI